MFCHQCGQKLPDGARFCIQCGTAIAAASPDFAVKKSLSEQELIELEDSVRALRQTAKRGTVTDDDVRRAVALLREIHMVIGQTSDADPKFTEMQETLAYYQDVASALETVKKRWEQDRQKGYIHKREKKLVVADYLLYAKSGLSRLGEHLGIPPFMGKRVFRFSLYKGLYKYLDVQVLDELFGALLMDEEDPKSFRQEYASVKQRFDNGYVESLLKKLTTPH